MFKHHLTLAVCCALLAGCGEGSSWKADLNSSGRANSALLAMAELTAKPAAAETPFFDQELNPFLKKYCYDCHTGAEAEKGIAFEYLAKSKGIAAHRKTWEKVMKQLRARGMPPKDETQPTAEEIAKITGWIEQELSSYDCNLNFDPGRVTVRRLNRFEYDNTIRDLLGVQLDLADEFPSDDVGYGFDNIGDVLSLPPMLMEKYLAVAERVAEKAIVVKASRSKQRFEAENVKSTTGGKFNKQAFNLWSNGDVYAPYDFPADGTYIIRAHVAGMQAGKDPVKMGFNIDEKPLHSTDVTNELEDYKTYEAKLQVKAGTRRVGVGFLNDFVDQDAKDPKRRDRNLIVDWFEVDGPLASATGALPESHKRIVTAEPSKTLSRADAARQVLKPLVTRAFRRPAEQQEVEQLVRLVELAEQQGDSYEQGIRLALEAILVSPHFLYRIETDPKPNDPEASRQINEWELATRLSYFLWSTMPDEELFRLAGQGQLRKQLDAQVRRMLKDPKSQSLVDNFAGQWLQFRNLDTVTPDPGRYKGWSNKLRHDMAQETALFFASIVSEDRSILELIDADYTFLNARLAKLYGIEGVSGEKFQRVVLKDRNRGGVLTQASVLTVTSNPTRTSPVKRGKWIMEQILGTPPPPPPPNVKLLAEGEQAELKGSLRERMEQHRADPNCAVCHEQMDTLGFGFENFDGIGRWRDKDGNFPIDASGVLPDGSKFNSPAELKAKLTERKEEFSRCLAEKMLTYATGRGMEFYDKCALDQIAGKIAAGNYKFSALVLAIVHSDPFQMRRGDGGSE